MKHYPYLNVKESMIVDLALTIKFPSPIVDKLVLKTRDFTLIHHYVFDIKKAPLKGAENFFRWRHQTFQLYQFLKKGYSHEKIRAIACNMRLNKDRALRDTYAVK